MAAKQRLTITVDGALVDAGREAVATGAADSVSGWVAAALEEKVRRDQKLRLLAAAIADYEDEFGAITLDEMAVQQRVDRGSATVIRGEPQRSAQEPRPA